MMKRARWQRWGAVVVAFGLTAALGCASPQEEENYKELRRDRDQLQPEQDPMFDSRREAQPDAADEARLVLVSQTTASVDVPAVDAETEPEASAAADTAVPQPAEAATQPYQPTTLLGSDRQNWPPIAFRAASGKVTHPPIYIGTPLPPDRTGQLVTGPVASRLRTALAGADNDLWTAKNLKHLPYEPIRFYAEALILPVKAIFIPPWTTHTTP